jgi:TOMM system kinase/cyclase fusion protein
MRCPSCGFENAERMTFCTACGTRLQQRCLSCGFANTAQAQFCGQCGTALGAARKPALVKSRKGTGARTPKRVGRSSRQPASASSRPASPEAERRQLTVMFCDLVGSTALSEQLDPEELREVVQSYQETCTDIIQRHDGHIAQHLGDGLLVYFGYPVAHENDAQRAVRTGLRIVEALHHLNTRLAYPLQVRIGIHTGLVVVGEIGSSERREMLALGETPNLAARLQALAEPNTVLISAATARLVHGLFECRELGPRTVKGLSTPLAVYQVGEESTVHSRFEVAIRTGLTPLVGREQEVGLLLDHWEQAKAGEGQVVLLSGEPGIGKSRLLQVLSERLAGETYARVECRCSPFYQNTALYPVSEHLQRLLRFTKDDSPQEKLNKLEGTLRQYGFVLPEVVPLFAPLLSLPLPEHYPPLSLSPQRQKQRTLEALVNWILKEAERQPVRLDLEDLHWVDPSTGEFLTLLLDQVPTARLLVLLTFRPEFRPPWAMRSHMTQLTLRRLAPKQAGEMVEKVTGGKALPPWVVQQVLAKTDGVPLFVEEMTKTVLESMASVESIGSAGARNHPSLQALTIPATLQDSLMARLDRLGPAKEVAQLGATLGREFSSELIQAVSPLEEARLQQALSKLVEAELLYPRGLPPQARYVFKHALIQDAAYQSLLKSTRQQYHQQITQVLEERFPETVETQPELLAHHYTEAGLVGQAIPYWQQAGQRATERSAHMEAIGQLVKGLELLKTLPDTPERVQQELTLQIALGLPLIATKGYGVPEVEHAYTRARELCRQVGETPQLFPALLGLSVFHMVRAEYQTARELGEQCLGLAQRAQAPAFITGAHSMLGMIVYYLGEFSLARAHAEQGIALYDPQQPRSWLDHGVGCLSSAVSALWLLGYPDQALKRSDEMLTLARALAHPPSLGFALYFAAELHQLRREAHAAEERAEAAITLSTAQGLPSWLANCTVLRGWALAEQGQGEAGIAQLRQGLAAHRATGEEVARPYFLALLAGAYGKVGQPQEGLTALAEALALVDQTGERFYEAELYRLQGELTLQTSVQSLESRGKEVEACFHKAMETARRQQAKSLELRAVMSLSRLWQQQGKQHEAHQLLAEIYGWFTEGFDTKDLQEAKTLLDELTEEQ